MKKRSSSFRSNARYARILWGEVSSPLLRSLKELTERYDLSVVAGDLQLLDGRWYVTHSGLIGLAARTRCRGINVQQVREFCDAGCLRLRYTGVAVAVGSSRMETLVPQMYLLWCAALKCGLPKPVPSILPPEGLRHWPLLRRGAWLGTEAATRARPAEGRFPCANQRSPKRSCSSSRSPLPSDSPALTRCQSCQGLRRRLLRHSQFAGCLSRANRDFHNQLADWAAKDSPALLCKLNSYSKPHEVAS